MAGGGVLLILAASLATVCAEPQKPKLDLSPKTSWTITVTSTAFAQGAKIPERYSAYSSNVSPALAWTAPPSKTKAVVLVVHDPDAPRAGGFYHWTIYNLAPETTSLPEKIGGAERLNQLGSAMQGANDGGKIGYMGPKPPAGNAHHYHFRIYALDQPVQLQPGASAGKVLAAMSGHVLAVGDLMGTYKKK